MSTYSNQIANNELNSYVGAQLAKDFSSIAPYSGVGTSGYSLAGNTYTFQETGQGISDIFCDMGIPVNVGATLIMNIIGYNSVGPNDGSYSFIQSFTCNAAGVITTAIGPTPLVPNTLATVGLTFTSYVEDATPANAPLIMPNVMSTIATVNWAAWGTLTFTPAM
jgi:hypothetical protein